MQSFLHIKKIMLVNLLLFSSSLFSQKDTTQYFNKTLSNNNFSIEVGGKGFLYSIGYERTIFKSKKMLLAAGVNFSYYPPYTGIAGLDGIMLPIGLSAHFGKSTNKLSVGINASNYFANDAYLSIYNDYPLYQLFFVPSIGYRKYFKKGNSLSIAFTPFFGTNPWYADIPWAGLNYNIKF